MRSERVGSFTLLWSMNVLENVVKLQLCFGFSLLIEGQNNIFGEFFGTVIEYGTRHSYKQLVEQSGHPSFQKP